MPEGARRGVTRGYVLGLIVATLATIVSLVVAVWGVLGVVSGRAPIESKEAPLWFGVVAILTALAMLATLLWWQAIELLRGKKTPSWGIMLIAGCGAYLLWDLAGVLAGLRIEETWLSPYAFALAPIWWIAVLLFWAVLARRVYTDRPTPQWPWERREPEG